MVILSFWNIEMKWDVFLFLHCSFKGLNFGPSKIGCQTHKQDKDLAILHSKKEV